MFENKVFNELLNRYHENKLAHAFLFETNNLERCRDELIKFIKIINCSEEYNSECKSKSCNICYLIDNNSFPNLIDIYPDGTQIKKTQIKELMEKFNKIPVFSSYNIYIVNECDLLNSSSANSILKFLEEPSDNVVGFYLTKNKMNVISTIRSRCQEYSLYYEENDSNIEIIDKIEKYLNSVYKNSDAILYNKLEGIKYFNDRKEWISFFNDMVSILYNVLIGKKRDYNLDIIKDSNNERLVKLIDLVQTVLKYLQSNGNIELILDKFVIEMRNIYE